MDDLWEKVLSSEKCSRTLNVLAKFYVSFVCIANVGCSFLIMCQLFIEDGYSGGGDEKYATYQDMFGKSDLFVHLYIILFSSLAICGILKGRFEQLLPYFSYQTSLFVHNFLLEIREEFRKDGLCMKMTAITLVTFWMVVILISTQMSLDSLKKRGLYLRLDAKRIVSDLDPNFENGLRAVIIDVAVQCGRKFIHLGPKKFLFQKMKVLGAESVEIKKVPLELNFEEEMSAPKDDTEAPPAYSVIDEKKLISGI